jgi:TolB-like protein/DNA-binding winged helix-turn-helix (wHTH) protein/Flp pilus assembly protein TadD
MTNPIKQFYEFGPFRLDPADRQLLRDGQPVPLRPKVFDILVTLVARRGRLVEKDELLRVVWPGQFVEEGNLNKSISTLRQALGESPASNQYIETVPKHGYRFVADVRAVDVGGEDADSSAEAPVPIPSATGAEAAPAQTAAVAKGARWRGVLLALSALGVAILVLAVFTGKRRSASEPPVTSLAVLPLENLSGDPAQEYFADGMTDALIGELAKIGELRVISRTSSMHYKGTKKPLPEIAAELKVDAVVEGSVQRAGDRVQIRAQLIHGATDGHLWAETYERDLRDVLALQSEIAAAVAREVRIKTTSPEQARLTPRRPVHPRAFDEYLKGRHVYWNRRTDEDLRTAIAHFERAIREDPDYARAYVAIADCYNSLGLVMFGASLPPMEARRNAEEAAAKALELDSSLAEAHTALGVIEHFNWHWDAAEKELKQALALDRNSASAHGLHAGYLMSRGRAEEAVAASSRARELDPLSVTIAVQRGFLLENARRYDEAIHELRRVVAANPQQYQAHWFLGHTLAANGQFEEGIASAEKAVELSRRAPGALGMLGLAYGLGGRKAEARGILNELLELDKQRYVTPAALVNVYIGLGDKDQAFAWLEKAYQERSAYVAWIKVFPILDPLRSDPRFTDLLRRVGLAE